MKLKKPHKNIFLLLGDSPADLGRAFVRVQEFYESPAKRFRRRFFTLSQFSAWYCRTQSESGRFTYYRDYYGYNVPGDVFTEWATTYAGHETEAEQELLGMIGPLPKEFYVIGAPKSDGLTIDHELSHAFFHLFAEYRGMTLAQFNGHDLSAIRRYLRGNMYADPQLDDEIVSYIMFDDALLHRGGVSTKELRPLRDDLLRIYRSYKKEFVRL